MGSAHLSAVLWVTYRLQYRLGPRLNLKALLNRRVDLDFSMAAMMTN